LIAPQITRSSLSQRRCFERAMAIPPQDLEGLLQDSMLKLLAVCMAAQSRKIFMAVRQAKV
jgi:hypothetical protein